MTNFFHSKMLLGCVLIGITGLLSACAGSKYAYEQESFDSKGPFDHHYKASKQAVFESFRRVALRQGFAIEKEDKQNFTLVVSKQYQHGERNTLLTISGLITGGSTWADSWVAAQEVTLKSDSATQTASVGLGLGLSIPVPTGTASTLTKERGETVKDPSLYNKIYAAVDKELPEVSVELQQSRTEDDAQLRIDIEKRLRLEAEIKTKLEHEAAQKNTSDSSAPAVDTPAKTSSNTSSPVTTLAHQ